MKYFVVISLIVASSISALAHEYHHQRPYKFDYGVSDHHTHDHHQQHEESDGHVVRGSYSLKEADGTTRIVKYVAGPHSGFNAIVEKVGHAKHPQHYHHHQRYFGGDNQINHGSWDAESYVGKTHWGYNY